jgi:N-methylhydantoinase B
LLGDCPAQLTIRSDRRDHLPYGLAGGKPGCGSLNVLRHSDNSEEVLPVMISRGMAPGDTLHHRLAGGGGWGDPRERDPQAVLEDVIDDRVSISAARDVYRVVIDPDALEVDQAATAELRELTPGN